MAYLAMKKQGYRGWRLNAGAPARGTVPPVARMLPVIAWGCLVLHGSAFASNAKPAVDRIDIGGNYVEDGMVVRANGAMPAAKVSLCALLGMDVRPQSHAALAAPHRSIRVTQTDDLVVAFLISGGSMGACRSVWTKAEGLRVEERAVHFVKKDRGTSFSYTIRSDNERRLLVSVDVSVKRLFGRVERGHAEYAFPRLGDREP